MVSETKAVLERALALPAIERAEVAERLIESLDLPDPDVDLVWSQECENRIAAFEQGKIGSVSEEGAFAGLGE